jgi:hypothetical protein
VAASVESLCDGAERGFPYRSFATEGLIHRSAFALWPFDYRLVLEGPDSGRNVDADFRGRMILKLIDPMDDDADSGLGVASQYVALHA